MRQLLYISSATPGMIPEVAAILATSIRNNRRAGVTGLLYTNGKRFLQVLEGDDTAVQTTLQRIRADGRHRGLVVLHDRQVEERQFGEWAMAERRLGEQNDAFDRRMGTLLAKASPAVRGTFEGLAATLRAA